MVLESKGYHVRVNPENRHTHVCNTCGRVYWHQHQYITPLLQHSYGNVCDSCEEDMQLTIPCGEQKDSAFDYASHWCKQLFTLGEPGVWQKRKHLEWCKRDLVKEYHKLCVEKKEMFEFRQKEINFQKFKESNHTSPVIIDLLKEMCREGSLINVKECQEPYCTPVYLSEIDQEDITRGLGGLMSAGYKGLLTLNVDNKFVTERYVTNMYTHNWTWIGASKIGCAFLFQDSLFVMVKRSFESVLEHIRAFLSGCDSDINHVMLLHVSFMLHSILKENNLYLSKVVKARMIGFRERIDIAHIHASPNPFDQIYGYRIFSSEFFDVYRDDDGYQFYGSVSVIEEVYQYCNDNPIQHLSVFNFHMERVKYVDDIEKFLFELTLNVHLCGLKETYEKLIYCLSSQEYYNKALGLLRLSHAILYEEKCDAKILVLTGDPGCGKSHFAWEMCKGHSVYHAKYDERCRNFWDGYYGQDIVVFDDLGHYSDNEWIRMIELVSETAVPLPMSQASQKGKVFFCSPLVIITTNKKENISRLPETSRKALNRRLEFINFETLRERQYLTYQLYRSGPNTYVDILTLNRNDMLIWAQIFKRPITKVEIKVERNYVDNVLKILDWSNQFVFSHIPYLKHIAPMIDLLVGAVNRTAELLINPLVDMYPGLSCYIPRCVRQQYYRLSRCERLDFRRTMHSFLSGMYGNLQDKVIHALAEGGDILNYDMARPHVNEPIKLCGVMVEPFDLTPNIKPMRKVTQLASPPRVDVYNKQQIEMFPEILEFHGQFEGDKFVVRKEASFSTIERKGYILENLSPLQKRFYKEGVFSELHAPLSDEIAIHIDESAYKPFSPITVRVRKAALNKIIQEMYLKKNGNGRTQKRKEERKRAKLRNGS